jgi:hypothetical protein
VSALAQVQSFSRLREVVFPDPQLVWRVDPVVAVQAEDLSGADVDTDPTERLSDPGRRRDRWLVGGVGGAELEAGAVLVAQQSPATAASMLEWLTNTLATTPPD